MTNEQRVAIEEAAQKAWEEDARHNPNPCNPYAYNYGFKQGAKEVIEHPERYCLTQIPHWNIGPEMPDYDGDYLCVIVRENECGTQSIFYSVIECRMNKWVILDDRTSVSKWIPLPEIHTINEVGKQ